MNKLRLIKLSKADKIRFWSKVDQCGPDECWEWQASCQSKGYGRFRVGDYSAYRAHRVAFAIVKGDTKLQVCHTCNNPPCCNPNHLYAGSQKDNIRQCVADGRYVCGDFCGEANNCAKLTDSDVCRIRAIYVDGWLQREIAEEYGIDQSGVSRICRGKQWKHI